MLYKDTNNVATAYAYNEKNLLYYRIYSKLCSLIFIHPVYTKIKLHTFFTAPKI